MEAHPDEAPPDVFRASHPDLAAAVLVGAVAVFAALTAAAMREDPDPASVFALLLLATPLLLVARAIRNVRVEVRTDGLFLHSGWRPYLIAWGSVQGVWRCADGWRGGVYVFLVPDGVVRLPLATAVGAVRPNQHEGDAMVAAIEARARQAGSPLLDGDLAAEAARRLPLAPVPAEWRA